MMPSVIGNVVPVNVFNGIASWATVSFGSFLGVAFMVAGVIVGALILAAVFHVIQHGVASLVFGPHYLTSEKQDAHALKAIELHRNYMRVKSGRGIFTGREEYYG